jgi:TolB-like protein
MLTGEYPFPEGQGRWAAEPRTPRKLEVPGAPELADVVEMMLEPVPTHRPRDGAAVLAALAPVEEKLRARPADGKPPVHAKRRKATLGDLLVELRRRHVFRVMVGYGVFSFAVLQVIEPVMHGAGLPDWVLKAVLVALVLGFPVAVVLAWIYDLTAQGVKRTSSTARLDAPSFGRSRVLLPLAVAATVLVLAAAGAGAWYAWKRAADRPAVASTGTAPSVAVLPFNDLSPEHDQEYFSDGMAEEILSRLSRVKGLRVPGRVSSFFFRGRNVEPAEIARKLRVTHLLEGSVRRSGNKLRIRAEVVRASDGETIWSETFDRDLTDVLAVQDEIARSAVQQLAPMLLAQAPPPAAASVDPEAYRLYLLGLSHFRKDSLGPALEALHRSTALDPRFAPAQAVLAAVASFVQQGTKGEDSRRAGKAGREAAERAVALDPSHSYGYVTRAWYRARQDWDWKGAFEDLDRALALDPANEWALNTRAILARTLGRNREALELQRRSVDLDPLNAFTTVNLAAQLAAEGRLDEARECIQRSLELSPDSKNAARILGTVALLEGKADEALAAFARIPEPTRSAGIVAALHSLGREQESRDALLRMERDHADAPFHIAGARAWRGDVDGAFAALDRAVEEKDPALTAINWSPFLRPVRGDPRWKAVLRKMNLPVD